MASIRQGVGQAPVATPRLTSASSPGSSPRSRRAQPLCSPECAGWRRVNFRDNNGALWNMKPSSLSVVLLDPELLFYGVKNNMALSVWLKISTVNWILLFCRPLRQCIMNRLYIVIFVIAMKSISESYFRELCTIFCFLLFLVFNFRWMLSIWNWRCVLNGLLSFVVFLI